VFVSNISNWMTTNTVFWGKFNLASAQSHQAKSHYAHKKAVAIVFSYYNKSRQRTIQFLAINLP